MYSELLSIVPREQVKFDELMRNHTTFRIGGPADVLVEPAGIEQLQKVLACCRRAGFPCFILGAGSNLLVRDGGIRGVVIKLGDKLQEVHINDSEVYAQSGTRLSALSKIVARHSLSGLEFAEGIPGTLGGAIVMNAGAYGGEMKDIINVVTVVEPGGLIKTLPASELNFSYRSSCLQDSGDIVVGAGMTLQKDDPTVIQKRMKGFAEQRKHKQPLQLPSAGSTFRRPPGHFVGPMLEELNLKGYQVGGAQVSTKHAGFIVNTGNATAADVLGLIKEVQERVKEAYGVELKPEIKVVGEG